VVATNSFVNKDIPPYSVAAGIPAKIIGRVVVKNNGEVKFVYRKKRKK
jgi:acetyltransferase-like isoleucine patch superfamily enzyme